MANLIHSISMTENKTTDFQNKQTTAHLMMVRPINFGFNPETAVNNFFQVENASLKPVEIALLAQTEFDLIVDNLRNAGVRVIVFQDDEHPYTPDSVFPNNWVSFHEDGRIAVFPMFAPGRRNERREEMFDILADDFGFEIKEIEDFTHFEDEGLYLEGTGSVVLDRINRKAYAALSDRTDFHAFETFCDRFDYEGIAFKAYLSRDDKRVPIYHTNVMMGIGSKYCVICLNAIDHPQDRQVVRDSLKSSGRKIIEISEAQMLQFAGNILAVENRDGKEFCVMSSTAHASLRPDQLELLSKYATIIHSPLPTIELLGGGSARCMIAEIFLPVKVNS